MLTMMDLPIEQKVQLATELSKTKPPPCVREFDGPVMVARPSECPATTYEGLFQVATAVLAQTPDMDADYVMPWQTLSDIAIALWEEEYAEYSASV
jgi:hypothetical protein